MAKVDSFEEFLKKKHNKESQKEFNWEKRRERWILSVNDLYDEIKAWLAPFSKQKLLKIQPKAITLDEDLLGTYTIDRLDLYIGKDLISLIPRGTLIQGGVGIIDMRASSSQVRLFQEKWDQWKFYIKTPFLEIQDVNKLNFEKIIQDLVNA